MSEIPNLREACDLKDMSNGTKCCNNCQDYIPCAMADPAGFCRQYPSQRVNTAAPYICDGYKGKEA